MLLYKRERLLFYIMEEDYPANITLVIHYVNKDNNEFFLDDIVVEPVIVLDIEEELENILENKSQIEMETQTDEITVETSVMETQTYLETDEIETQTEKIKTGEIETQTDEIILEKIKTGEIETQTDEIILEKIKTDEIETQTDEIILDKIKTDEIETQTDNISNNYIEIETQTEYLMEKEDMKQILPDILIQNLSHDILLQISKVLTCKKEKTSEELEQEYREREQKKEEKFLREIKWREKEIEIDTILREKEKENKREDISVPKIIFVVPYRDREQQYLFFHKQMTKEILVDYPPGSYKLWYIHQCDNRDFNRGAMKNIGFLVAKQQYPNDYKNITLVFNDVDTMPFNRNFLNYETCPGIIKHFYGYDFALGGIVSMNAHDFERINGYPNLWGWGFEDNCLQVRVNKADNLQIDRGQFYPILDKNILQLTDGVTRIVNRSEFDQYYHNTTEGIYSITNLNYDIDEKTGFVNIRNFNTGREQDLNKRKLHDLRNGAAPFNPNDKNQKNRKKSMMGLLF